VQVVFTPYIVTYFCSAIKTFGLMQSDPFFTSTTVIFDSLIKFLYTMVLVHRNHALGYVQIFYFTKANTWFCSKRVFFEWLNMLSTIIKFSNR
jgi:hypothetical protein